MTEPVPPPRHVVARACALVVVRLAWSLLSIGVPLVAVIAALALLAAGQ
jgi:hypothetical protein